MCFGFCFGLKGPDPEKRGPDPEKRGPDPDLTLQLQTFITIYTNIYNLGNVKKLNINTFCPTNMIF